MGKRIEEPEERKPASISTRMGVTLRVTNGFPTVDELREFTARAERAGVRGDAEVHVSGYLGSYGGTDSLSLSVGTDAATWVVTRP